MLRMKQILKQANAIFVLKQKKQACLLIYYICSLYMLITNQINKQANAICFKIKNKCLCLNNIKSIVCLY